MVGRIVISICLLLYFFDGVHSAILCEDGFCHSFIRENGCTPPAVDCSINNATHTGMWLPSPTICNCCEYCLPWYGEDQHCSVGGPGTGTTVGRCGYGLTCEPHVDGHNYCERMDSACHRAQNDYDRRHALGQTGSLEERPGCDEKGNYAAISCVPTQTCFCQSADGKRLFGEALYLGTATTQNMQCGCSKFHENMKSISDGVPEPVIGPRCTANGNFNPVQCVNNTCYCVHPITGRIQEGEGRRIDLAHENITRLACYDRTLDLFPEQNEGKPPFNHTTPCFLRIRERAEWIEQSKEDGYNMDFHNSIPGCLPDGTFERTAFNRNGSKICIDEYGNQIGDYEAEHGTTEFDEMDCKCAQTSLLMAASTEKPVCCKNGNFRRIQCRRGMCRCVDSDGRQVGLENQDVMMLRDCWTNNWRIC